MKKIFTVLAIITSILAIILSILPVSNLAIIPAIAALIFGIVAFYLSKKTGQVKKIIQFTFLLTSTALVITIYKSVFNETKVEETEILEAKEIKSEADAIEELEDLDIDTDELEDITIQ